MTEPPISTPIQPAAYPRGNISSEALLKIAAGMKQVNTAAIVWLALSVILPAMSLQGSSSETYSNRSPEYQFGRLMGQLAIGGFGPSIVASILVCLGLQVVGQALGWNKATAFLIPLGVVLTSCICGGFFFYIGIIVAVNRRLSQIGAPDWSSLKPQNLIAFASRLDSQGIFPSN